VYISLEDIRHVEFSRISESSAQQRTFDLTIVKKNEQVSFSGFEKNELEPLTNYFGNKKIRIQSSDGGNVKEIKPSVKIEIIILFLLFIFYIFFQTVTTSSRRARKAPEEIAMELPSEESEFDEDYNSDDGNDMDVDDEDSEEESERDKKKKKKK